MAKSFEDLLYHNGNVITFVEDTRSTSFVISSISVVHVKGNAINIYLKGAPPFERILPDDRQAALAFGFINEVINGRTANVTI